jgi:hypothetical protein
LSDIAGYWPLQNLVDFVRIRFNSIARDDVPKESNGLLSEVTFVKVKNHLCIVEGSKDLFDMLLVLNFGATVDKDVIEINHAKLIQIES